jgi:hypothetical protein
MVYSFLVEPSQRSHWKIWMRCTGPLAMSFHATSWSGLIGPISVGWPMKAAGGAGSASLLTTGAMRPQESYSSIPILTSEGVTEIDDCTFFFDRRQPKSDGESLSASFGTVNLRTEFGRSGKTGKMI